jgi:hypothetical protein
VRQSAGVLTFVGLDADQEVEHAPQLVGDLHELHRVHVAREQHEPAGAVRRKRATERVAELVELQRVAGRAIVADGEGPGRVEGRPSDDRVGIQDAEPRHHEHVSPGRTGIERPSEELLQRLRGAAVHGADEFGFDRLPGPERDPPGAGLEIEVRGRRHPGGAADRAQFLERRDERIAGVRAVEVTAQVEEHRPFLRHP